MDNLPMELVELFEHRIREAAAETGSAALLRNADRLLDLIKARNPSCTSDGASRPIH